MGGASDTGQAAAPRREVRAAAGGEQAHNVNTLQHAADSSIDDKCCEVCGYDGDEAKMILCDDCERGYHIYCLNPKLKRVPKGDWFCSNCRGKPGEAGASACDAVTEGGSGAGEDPDVFARTFLQKVEQRFAGQRSTFDRFLNVLVQYKRRLDELRPCASGAPALQAVYDAQVVQDVKAQVAVLLAGHPDLLAEFALLLDRIARAQHAQQHARAAAGRVHPAPPQGQGHKSVSTVAESVRPAQGATHNKLASNPLRRRVARRLAGAVVRAEALEAEVLVKRERVDEAYANALDMAVEISERKAAADECESDLHSRVENFECGCCLEPQVCVCTHTHTHARTHAHAHTHTRTRTHTHTHTHTHMHAY